MSPELAPLQALPSPPSTGWNASVTTVAVVASAVVDVADFRVVVFLLVGARLVDTKAPHQTVPGVVLQSASPTR